MTQTFYYSLLWKICIAAALIITVLFTIRVAGATNVTPFEVTYCDSHYHGSVEMTCGTSVTQSSGVCYGYGFTTASSIRDSLSAGHWGDEYCNGWTLKDWNSSNTLEDVITVSFSASASYITGWCPSNDAWIRAEGAGWGSGFDTDWQIDGADHDTDHNHN